MSQKILRTNSPPADYTGCVQTSTGRIVWFKVGVIHREDGPAVSYPDGSLYYYQNGGLHRIDGPAVMLTNGRKEWWIQGKKHRVDGPAVECEDGHQEWWFEGKKHRLDGPAELGPDGFKAWWIEGQLHSEKSPAILHSNGTKEWYIQGKKHRIDGPAEISYAGDETWYKNGVIHREGGPACELKNGQKFWFKEGQKHREDGPAIEYPDGYKEYWVHNIPYSEEKFELIFLKVKTTYTVIVKKSNFLKPRITWETFIDKRFSSKEEWNPEPQIIKSFTVKKDAESFATQENGVRLKEYFSKQKYLNNHQISNVWEVFDGLCSNYLINFLRESYSLSICHLDFNRVNILDFWWNYDKGTMSTKIKNDIQKMRLLGTFLTQDYKFCFVDKIKTKIIE